MNRQLKMQKGTGVRVTRKVFNSIFREFKVSVGCSICNTTRNKRVQVDVLIGNNIMFYRGCIARLSKNIFGSIQIPSSVFSTSQVLFAS
ncbi:unnamed protein product [Pseudo-nitzschia multistriata]|uniref:Uncharacterized protein n=1 Tax=Pseudo-nitzschia multistriata TaxID=183589 RepID=A0A448ZAK2_9STRA|nr:unnamed protein product [Pseudo-nitzschia multistriata]